MPSTLNPFLEVVERRHQNDKACKVVEVMWESLKKKKKYKK